jgi:hypothetical protein
MILSESILQLRVSLDNAESEIKSLEGGRKASAARARKALQTIKLAAHELRKQITETTKAMPVKSRVKQEVVCPTDAAIVSGNIEPEPTPKRSRKKKELNIFL